MGTNPAAAHSRAMRSNSGNGSSPINVRTYGP